MLSWNQVLNYIRGIVALPSAFIEFKDEEIINWCKNTALREYSTHFPDTERVSVLSEDPRYKHPVKNNQYYIFDEEGLEIYGIKECYFSMQGDFWSGHPPFEAANFEGAKWWALSVFQSKFFKPFTSFNYTYKFYPPNIVEVLGGNFAKNLGNFVVEYQRMQPNDLRKITMDHSMDFMDLCLAHTMIWIGSKRSYYGDGRISTPFGEIPLSGDSLLAAGRDARRDVVDRLQNDSMPIIIMDIGGGGV